MATLAQKLREEGKKIGIEEGMKAGIEKGIKTGIEKGMKQGMKEKAKETAKKLLEKGIDIKIIAEVTGFSIKEIKKLTSTSH